MSNGFRYGSFFAFIDQLHPHDQRRIERAVFILISAWIADNARAADLIITAIMRTGPTQRRHSAGRPQISMG